MSINSAAVTARKKQLLSPQPLSRIEELDRILQAKPHYIGPGPWLKIIGELDSESRKKS